MSQMEASELAHRCASLPLSNVEVRIILEVLAHLEPSEAASELRKKLAPFIDGGVQFSGPNSAGVGEVTSGIGPFNPNLNHGNPSQHHLPCV